jgi:hypothetical protein
MLDHPAVKRFIQLVESWNAPVWGELLLWETLEGKRDKPFLFLDPLTVEDMQMLKTLRDELKKWPTYVPGSWELMPLKVWRIYAKEHPADSVRDRLHEPR